MGESCCIVLDSYEYNNVSFGYIIGANWKLCYVDEEEL